MRTIPIIDQRHLKPELANAIASGDPIGQLLDGYDRPLHDLRISVTDRCNFRCTYCMPKEVFNASYSYLPHASLLSFEEITRLARQFVARGVKKIRLTGGEPLLRKHLEVLIEQLAALRTPAGEAVEITLTTNGALLARQARSLKDAGLNRITVSLDGLDDQLFRRINDVDFPVSGVLAGLEAASKAGFSNTKVNMVVKRGCNEQEILPMARYFQGSGTILRLIEYMDVGASNGWCIDEVLPSAEIVKRVHEVMPLVALTPSVPGETAERWGYVGADGQYDPKLGEIGVISSVTNPFCGGCNRARISTEGKLFLCLFATDGHDLRGLMRKPGASTDAQLQAQIVKVWQARTDRYSEMRTAELFTDRISSARRVEMSYIGG